MPTECIAFRDTNYFSDLICNYIEEQPEFKTLYNRFPNIANFELQIKEKSKTFDTKKRQVLVKVLNEQYNSIKTSKLTQQHIDSLESDQTFTITTGHQLNLFTGPLYFLYKIISTINLTKELKAAYPNYNFAPIYWMASEDHDFEEINYFNFRGKKIRWNRQGEGAVGHYNTEGLDVIYKILESEFGYGEHAETLRSWFKDAYMEHDNLADATRYLANTLFGEHGLVIIDADDKALKDMFVPYIKNDIINQVSYKNVSETNTYIEELGYKVQVNPREINFFYIDQGLRERVVYENNQYKVNNTNTTWDEAGLINDIKNNPERFSPNVIMRPLYQEVILPNLCYIGGGGELAYWLQLKSNFEAHGITFPILLLRNSVLVKSEKQDEKLKRLDISTKDIFLKRDTYINKKVRKISNIDIDLSPQRQTLQDQFKHLYDIAKQTDKSFLGAVKAQEVKQIKGLNNLEKRLLKAQKKTLANEVMRMTEIQEQLFPGQSLQERNLNFSELYLEYGEALIPVLLKHLQPLQGEFLVLTI